MTDQSPPSVYRLADEPLADLLLALEASKSSADVHVNTPTGKASLSIRAGLLSSAQFGPLHGLRAARSLLSSALGEYRVEKKDSGPLGLRQVVGDFVDQWSEDAPVARRPHFNVSIPLQRTPQALPNGLAPMELRALSMVNGNLTALQAVSGFKESPEEALRAVRKLLQLGLVRQGKAQPKLGSTLSSGSGPSPMGAQALPTAPDSPKRPESVPPPLPQASVPASKKSDTLVSMQSPVPVAPAQRSNEPSLVAPKKPTSKTEPRKAVTSLATQASITPSQEPGPWTSERPSERSGSSTPPSEVPARFAKRSLDQSGSRYSSKPPTGQESEDVKLPSSGKRTAPPADISRASKTKGDDSFDAVRPERAQFGTSMLGTLSADSPKEKPKSISNTMHSGSAPGVQDFDGSRPLPLPTHEDDWQDDEAEDSHRETIHDDLVVEAAEGQLSASEMPVPSANLGQASLEQLDELNEALSSARPGVPHFDEEPASPGSVPGPDALPGSRPSFDADSGLPTVGRYEVLARLKSGGMGSVYMCRLSGNAGFRRLFAMKVLHGHLAEEEEALEAFFHEARVLSGLHHPNIVGIVDVGSPSQPYIVLDYVEGGSMLELYRASTEDRDASLIVKLILDALAGLGSAHEGLDENGQPLRLVHCDITPHNLLVGIDGGCRVTDFGIARTGSGTGQNEVTRGKPGYMAPERLLRQPSDHRSDVFSMGVVLYAGLTGIEPFAGATADETMRNVLNKVVKPPSEVGHKPPPCLDWICMKALARNPAERFQSAEQMAEQLRRIAAHEGLLASPSDVSNWVKSALAPTLAARRAASARGTVTEEGRRRLSSAPDPEVAPMEMPSAAETTGPISAPPPTSDGFADKTEILDAVSHPSLPGLPSEDKGGSSWRSSAMYLVLVAAVAALVWVVLFPTSVASVFKRAPESDHLSAGKAQGLGSKLQQGRQESKDNEAATKIKGHESGNIVIPDIKPAEGNR